MNKLVNKESEKIPTDILKEALSEYIEWNKKGVLSDGVFRNLVKSYKERNNLVSESEAILYVSLIVNQQAAELCFKNEPNEVHIIFSDKKGYRCSTKDSELASELMIKFIEENPDDMFWIYTDKLK